MLSEAGGGRGKAGTAFGRRVWFAVTKSQLGADMDMQTRLTEDMKAAMKSGQKERLSVIRMLLSDVRVIDLNPQKPTAEQAVEAYAKKLRKSRDEYEKIGKPDEVTKLNFEIGVVEEYLPKRANATDTEQLVDAFLAQNSFTEKQVGQAMGAFIKAHAGTVDPALVNPLMRKKLAGKN
jgi:uncharacterized protein YqeY